MKTLILTPETMAKIETNKPKMMAKIAAAANDWGNNNNSKPDSLHSFLIANRGKWVEIDTKYIFDNQYNTKAGFRIYDKHIQEIKNDIRINLGCCRYCGTITKNALPCLKHTECLEYGVKDLSKSFFVQFPKGPDTIKQIDISDDGKKNKDFWNAYTVNGAYYRISRRHTLEFVLVAGVPYMVSIGFTHYSKAKLSANETRILLRVTNIINNL